MLGSSFDRLMSKHPIIAEFAGRRLDVFFSTSTFSNACCCVAASLGAGLISLLRNDLLYYAAAMVLVALTLLYINCGTLRLYLFAAIALGIYLYARFPGRLIRAKKAKRAKFTKKQLR